MTGILEREIALAQTQDIRELARPKLRAVLDEASGVFERCSQTAKGADENLGILMPFHHGIEMLDGEALLDASCVVASRPLLRSAHEAGWTVEYVVKEDSVRRGLCYVVGDLRERIRWYEQHDPETARGAQFAADMKLAENRDFPLPTPEDARSAAMRLRDVLAMEHFAPINAEYERTLEKRRSFPWHALFGGPGNTRELAEHVGHLDDYIVLYGAWSKTTHAVDMSRQVSKNADGRGPAVSVVRAPLGMPMAYAFACSLGARMTERVLAHYRPEELKRFSKWFLEEITPTTEKLVEMREEIAS